MVKKLLLMCSILAALATNAAVELPVSAGGYKYDSRYMLNNLIRRNSWENASGTIPPEKYKEFSVVYLGNLLKNEKPENLWRTPEKIKLVKDYLADGGVIIVNCHIPRELLGENFEKTGPEIFGFGSFTRSSKAKGAVLKENGEVMEWQRGMGPCAVKLAKNAEVKAWYIMQNGQKTAAVTCFNVGKGKVWWFSPSLMRLAGSFIKEKKPLGHPDDVGNFILSAEGRAVENLKDLYRQAFLSGKAILTNKEAKAWGTTPLGEKGDLKEVTTFKKPLKLRSGLPVFAPGLVLCDKKVQAVIFPASEKVKKLASELKYHLDKMSGRNFVIVDKYPGAKQNAVILGDYDAAKKFGVTPAHATRDTVVIKRKGNHLFVGGSRNGASHALTVLLEALGCRYLWPGVSGKVIPKRAEIIAPEIDMNKTVKFYMARSIRENDFYSGRYRVNTEYFGFTGDSMTALVKKHDRYAADNRRFFEWHGFNDDPLLLGWQKTPEQLYEWGHVYGHLFKKYGKQHPEFFALQPDGSRKQPERPRLCHSNKELPKVIAAEKIAQFKKYPHKQAVSVCLNDGGYSSMCMCIECRKLDPVNAPPAQFGVFYPVRKRLDYVSFSDRVLHFTNRVAEEVLKEVPGKQFCFYAYSSYVQPPVKVKPHPALIILSVAGTYTTEESRVRGMQSNAKWASFGNPMLWRPNALFGFPNQLMPQNFARKMFNDVETLKANNFIGNDMDCFEMLWSIKGLVYYALSKAQLNYHEVDYDTIFNDFCDSGFGKASPEIKKYFLLLEKLTDEAAKSKQNYFNYITDAVLAELQGCLDRAAVLEKDNAEILKRIEFLNYGMRLGTMHRKLHLAKDRTTKEYKAMQAEFRKLIKDITTENPFAVNPFKMGIYLPYLKK